MSEKKKGERKIVRGEGGVLREREGTYNYEE